jgi:O-antigen/teichoic acid export membrane protein
VNIRQKLGAIGKNAKGKLTQDSRNSKAALTGVITLVVRGISVGAGLLSIPITAQYLGKEQFGIWLLLSTFMSWISLADLGLTNSLVNRLSTSLAMGDGITARKSVSSAFFPMVLLGIVLSGTAFVFSSFIAWEQILNIRVSSFLQEDTRLAITIAMYFFAIKIPLSIPRCIYNAYQQGYVYQMWSGLGNLLSLLSLFVAQHYHANLPCLLGAFFGMSMLGDVFAGIDIFYYRQRWLKPKLVNCDPRSFEDLLKVGFQFWIAQICAICIFQTDLIIVSQLFGVVEVGTYGVLLRLFSTIDSVSSSFLLPLWPAYSDAQARRDYKWISKTFRNSIIGSFIWSLGAGSILVVFLPTLLGYLVNKDVSLPLELPLYMLFTFVLLSISQCVAMLVNGVGRLKLQSFVAPLSAITNLLLSIWLGKMMGMQGVTLATSICILFFSIFLVGGDSILGMKQISTNKNSFK